MTPKAVDMPHKFNRYMIIDSETGEILDDAQGYGYRTKQKAHAAWAYKHPSKKAKKNRNKNIARNKQFLKKHHKLDDLWAEMCLDAAKNGEEIGYPDFKALILEIEPDYNGNIYSLYRYFLKHD